VSDTIAMTSDLLRKAAMDGSDGRPLCPSCSFGRLQPYQVTISLNAGAGGWRGADYLDGWVAVCKGAKAGEHFVETDQPPCGFSMPMQARSWAQDRRDTGWRA
jgi:hypothetical protein